ncbi:uncharacterized protein CC84DRAFT_1166181 [Paraphaeosphaeria sporulosa]|uniref:MARVEL domain-containing protein n=1 Tax=Paraphaeosphaeria sporulosa TaxID=1460663 RepID=A0A177C915_9PLEO|nr:uncharacterized protein CC84DRAFT_1166181 [Paraphaeosphaeria sporulosa]OAG04055.1 hypothetical protein CC84DRAFT_1166181 [Paraphaeosphaeria sporulosa]
MSPRLKALQGAQLGIVALTLLATFLAAVVPHKHKSFTFGLLYPLLLTSASTTFLIAREQRRAREGALTKAKYAKYALLKLAAAFGLGFVGFVLDIATTDGKCDVQRPGETGLWIRCVKVETWQGAILWLNVFNWLFLWAGVFYSCCMSRRTEGAIALGGEEARIGLDNETENDEAIARDLQAQDPNWRA